MTTLYEKLTLAADNEVTGLAARLQDALKTREKVSILSEVLSIECEKHFYAGLYTGDRPTITFYAREQAHELAHQFSMNTGASLAKEANEYDGDVRYSCLLEVEDNKFQIIFEGKPGPDCRLEETIETRTSETRRYKIACG